MYKSNENTKNRKEKGKLLRRRVAQVRGSLSDEIMSLGGTRDFGQGSLFAGVAQIVCTGCTSWEQVTGVLGRAGWLV